MFSLKSFSNLKYDCVIKTRGMFSFLPLINNPVTTEFIFLLLSVSSIISSKTIIFYVFYLGYVLQWFYKYYPCYASIQ